MKLFALLLLAVHVPLPPSRIRATCAPHNAYCVRMDNPWRLIRVKKY